MPADRVTVSLDDDTAAALADLTDRTGEGQSEVIRRALTFYAANFDAASTDSGPNLAAYHRMLSGGEHVLLDIDFLHCFLDHVTDANGDPDPEFAAAADTVSDYHAREYADRFDNVGDLLEWLSFCGFLSVRSTEGDTYHVVFPSAELRWFMTRFIERSVRDLPFELDVEQSVSKVLITERRPT
ncbi:ribbon-helix-helix protein, CopG family [Halogranum rubrum]|uniref:Ribbon-helix-helix protein, copG family n=1 Tax=Halogranum salarium B-1 TaxID=1210908 RepID=J3EXN7_9EURY|nr:ribbon-helix-helix protein, CopG family [Halogranum salarium]EJN59917.1 Ribbon-helix-helix protein, copG family [Halogranum salarium B-1]